MPLARRIIPCLDVDQGRVVKGVNFVGIRDAGYPVEIARRYNEQGADEITFLDITASHEQRDTTVQTVERIAREVFIPLTVGGGVRALGDIRALLNAGADKVSINTAAIHNPDLVKAAAARFGAQCIVVAMDVKRVSADHEPPRYELFTHGGRKPTGIEAIAWARKMADKGAGEILLTSMDRDGTRDGFELTITRQISEAVDIPLIASGGVGSLAHLYWEQASNTARGVVPSLVGYGRVWCEMAHLNEPLGQHSKESCVANKQCPDVVEAVRAGGTMEAYEGEVSAKASSAWVHLCPTFQSNPSGQYLRII